MRAQVTTFLLQHRRNLARFVRVRGAPAHLDEYEAAQPVPAEMRAEPAEPLPGWRALEPPEASCFVSDDVARGHSPLTCASAHLIVL